jgi:hypothetical protein
MLNRTHGFRAFVCLTLILVLALTLSACSKGSDATDSGTPTTTEVPTSDPSSAPETSELNANDANSILSAVLSSPYITCLGKTRLEMDEVFGPIAGNEWVDGMLYYHENYPGMVSYTNTDTEYQVKEDDICIVVNILLRDVVPEIVGKSLTVDPGVWGECVLSDITSTYQYSIPIENGFMLITSDENGNIDLNSVIFAKLGE